MRDGVIDNEVTFVMSHSYIKDHKYLCEICLKTFDTKVSRDRHSKKKKPCERSDVKPKFKCDDCDRSFTAKTSLTRHHGTCRIKEQSVSGDGANINDGDNNKVTNIVGDENKIIKTVVRIEKLIIFNFGEDPAKNFTKEDVEEVLKKTDSYSFIVDFLEHVNLNPDKPMYHNVLYTSHKSATGKIFRDSEWHEESIKKICDAIIDSKIRFMKDILNEVELDEEATERISDHLCALDDMYAREHNTFLSDGLNPKRDLRMRRHIKSALVKNRALIKNTIKYNS